MSTITPFTLGVAHALCSYIKEKFSVVLISLFSKHHTHCFTSKQIAKGPDFLFNMKSKKEFVNLFFTYSGTKTVCIATESGVYIMLPLPTKTCVFIFWRKKIIWFSPKKNCCPKTPYNKSVKHIFTRILLEKSDLFIQAVPLPPIIKLVTVKWMILVMYCMVRRSHMQHHRLLQFQ